MNIFQQASMTKLRFQTVKGILATEDLWSLSQRQLDSMYSQICDTLQASSVNSLLNNNKQDVVLVLKRDIIAFIFAHNKDLEDAAKIRAEKLAQKHKLEELIASKRDEKLSSLSEEELLKMLQEIQ